jgi:hypothetical protein
MASGRESLTFSPFFCRFSPENGGFARQIQDVTIPVFGDFKIINAPLHAVNVT